MPPRLRFGALGVVFFVLASLTAPRSAIPGPLQRDFEAYYSAGATWNAGRDPYSREIWIAERAVPGVDAARDEILPFVGPAMTLPLWSLLARLPYRWAVVAWSAILGLAVVGLVAATLVLARVGCDAWRIAIVAGFVLASAPVRNSLALGQAALLSAACVALAIPAYRARLTLGACGATLFAAIQPNLALPIVAQIRSRWDLRVAGASALLFAGLTAAYGGGLPGFWGYLRHLAQHGRAERTITISHTPVAIAWTFGAPEQAALLVGSVIALLTLGIAIATAVRERLDAATATVLACAIVPLAMPFFHEQDFAITVVPLGVLLVRARGAARAAAAVAAVLLLVDWLSFAQRSDAAVQTVCLGFALVAMIAAVNPAGGRARRSDVAALTVLCILAAIALPLGRSHQAPTWPENLPTRYRATRCRYQHGLGQRATRERAGPSRTGLGAAALSAAAGLRAAGVVNGEGRSRLCTAARDEDHGSASHGNKSRTSPFKLLIRHQN